MRERDCGSVGVRGVGDVHDLEMMSPATQTRDEIMMRPWRIFLWSAQWKNDANDVAPDETGQACRNLALADDTRRLYSYNVP